MQKTVSSGACKRQNHGFSFGQKTFTREQREAYRQKKIEACDELFVSYLGIIRSIWGYEIRPIAFCERCQKSLLVTEIVIGFTLDPDDCMTECPQCRGRLVARNVIDPERQSYCSFWSSHRVSSLLPGLESLKPEELQKQQPTIFFSAVFHFGSLMNAFRRRRIRYDFEKFDWATKSDICLGKISDNDISELFGFSRFKVAEMRKKFKVSKFLGNRSIIPVNQQYGIGAKL